MNCHATPIGFLNRPGIPPPPEHLFCSPILTEEFRCCLAMHTPHLVFPSPERYRILSAGKDVFQSVVSHQKAAAEQGTAGPQSCELWRRPDENALSGDSDCW
jgi:hypothetical protein